MMQTGCWLIPREVIEKAGLWDSRFTLHDDGEFMCRVLLASDGNLFIDNALLYYRQSEGSLSRNNRSRTAAESALGVYNSYRDTILPIQDNMDVRWALAHNYARFLYEYHPLFPDLMQQAAQTIKDLGFQRSPIVGGARFMQMARRIGFFQALKLRKVLSGVGSVFMHRNCHGE